MTETTLENAAVEKIFGERKDFIIIGLTGRTGCGCTTVANLLSEKFDQLQPPIPEKSVTPEERAYQIIYEYAKNSWMPFRIIEMKHVIFTFVLENDFLRLTRFIDEVLETHIDISGLRESYDNLHSKRIEWKDKVGRLNADGENVPYDDDLYKFYFEEIPNYYREFQEAIPAQYYTKLLQAIGNNIRASGSAFSNVSTPENILNLSQRVNMLIKILRRRNIVEKKRVLVVIDALRNPYEAAFFKDRYSAFYLIAINATDRERKNRLVEKGYSFEDIVALDEKEYPSLGNTIRSFSEINIEKTVEISDIHIYNRNSNSKSLTDTKKQLLRYITLIMHPGLVPPTEIERCMQVAYDAKLNSGCLSRQVGAVITDSKYNIISMGWNTAPEGQIACNLRSLCSLIREDNDDDTGMSEFERTNIPYRAFLRKQTSDVDFSLLKGRNCAYCFKDAYNAHRNQKNQVHTRSIHAEEMAFLQAAKCRMPSAENGCLFTTASPCELCSKKAYHIGIHSIYYIDKYPGISYEHILNCGEKIPQMIPFRGAIGRAYTQLYTQIIPYKDELYMVLGLTFK